MVLRASTVHNVVEYAGLVLRRLVVPFDASNDFHSVVFAQLFVSKLRELARRGESAKQCAAESAVTQVSNYTVPVPEHLINMEIEVPGTRLVA